MAHLNVRILRPYGGLKITADNEARSYIREGFERDGYYGAEEVVAEFLHEKYDFVCPEAIGALTAAPILCASDDMEYNEETGNFTPVDNTPVFWFPAYETRDPWEELKNKGFVIFDRAP